MRQFYTNKLPVTGNKRFDAACRLTRTIEMLPCLTHITLNGLRTAIVFALSTLEFILSRLWCFTPVPNFVLQSNNFCYTKIFDSSSSSWQFISLLFSQHKKLNNRIKTISKKGMQVTKRIDVKHTQIFKDYIKKIVERGMVTAPDKNIKQKN